MQDVRGEVHLATALLDERGSAAGRLHMPAVLFRRRRSKHLSPRGVGQDELALQGQRPALDIRDGCDEAAGSASAPRGNCSGGPSSIRSAVPSIA